MNMVELIEKKKQGKVLTKEELTFFVKGITDGSIPEYQTSALLMAICFRGLTDEETFTLTMLMRDSGDVLDLSAIPDLKIDKHSTGGVGDKTTLVVAPLVAACGIPVAKMSGRGLGFTGGTVDKLQSVPGFQVELKPEEFLQNVKNHGIAVVGQSANMAKADKILYALRDVTATVDNKSLIAASIMSKKLAAGSDGILLDVKCGSGAFMNTREEAEELAKMMVAIGRKAGKKMCAMVTSMEQPLGRAVGNSSEMLEAIETLKGQGPEDLTALCLSIAARMIYMGEKAMDPEEGYRKAKLAMESGAALSVFKEFLKAQGGNEKAAEDVSILPRPAVGLDLPAWEDGYVSKLDALLIGKASQLAGAGREKKEDDIDLSAGVFLYKKAGEPVKKGDVLARVFGQDRAKAEKGLDLVREAYEIWDKKPEIAPLVRNVIEG